MTNGTSKTRAIVPIGLGLICGVLFFAYEELRRARENEFPFLFEPLFLHGLLLIALAGLVAFMIWYALQGARGVAWLTSALIGIPGLVLALAPYIVARLDWDFFPSRLVGDGFHQVGMVAVGAALCVLVLSLRRKQARAG